MTHPNPEIRAQYEADRALQREELEVIVDQARRRTGWRRVVEDAKLLHWGVVVVIAFVGGMLTAAWRGGASWETARRWRVSVDSQFVADNSARRSITNDIADLRRAIDWNRWKLDTIASRQTIVLLILCDGAVGLDLRLLCKSAGVMNGRSP